MGGWKRDTGVGVSLEFWGNGFGRSRCNEDVAHTKQRWEGACAIVEVDFGEAADAKNDRLGMIDVYAPFYYGVFWSNMFVVLRLSGNGALGTTRHKYKLAYIYLFVVLLLSSSFST